MKKYFQYLAPIFILAFFVPFIVSANNVADLQSQILSLQNQLKNLQTQQQELQRDPFFFASTTLSSTMLYMPNIPMYPDGDPLKNSVSIFCPQIVRNLGIGSQGDDVKQLQKMLALDTSLYTGGVTGYFGQQTAKSVAKFQVKSGISTSGKGFVGPQTREFLVKKCFPIIVSTIDTTTYISTSTNQSYIPDFLLYGTVLANSGSNITLLLGDNSTKIVMISVSTSLVRSNGPNGGSPTVLSMSNIPVGQYIMFAGHKNSDGTLQATTIETNVPFDANNPSSISNIPQW